MDNNIIAIPYIPKEVDEEGYWDARKIPKERLSSAIESIIGTVVVPMIADLIEFNFDCDNDQFIDDFSLVTEALKYVLYKNLGYDYLEKPVSEKEVTFTFDSEISDIIANNNMEENNELCD